MLSARLRVGDRMMGIGFIEGRLRTGWLGRNRHDRRKGCDQAAKAARNPRAAYIIFGAKSGLRSKPGRGTTESTPRRHAPTLALV